MNERDLIVIGAGPGGYVAAIRAAQLGFNVKLIEKEHLGGVCLNWGCIPTKALLKSAQLFKDMKEAHHFGIQIKDYSFDLDLMVKRSRDVASKLSQGIKALMKKNKVKVFDGTAVLKGNQTIIVRKNDGEETTLKAPHIILATGAKARSLPLLKEPHSRVWYAKEAMTPSFFPKNLLIIGSGAIGIEFASFYNTLGANVTVAELHDRILIHEDHEVSKFAQKSFEKQGIKFKLNTTISDIHPHETGVSVKIHHHHHAIREETFDAIIVAIGIVGHTEDIGLEKTKAIVQKGHIVVDEYCETDEKGLYAIGDVTEGPWLAHKASHEAIICVEKIAGHHPKTLNRSTIPSCVYSLPQVASVGLTEEKAIQKGYKIKVGRFPFHGNGKALALGESEGFVKTIFDENTGEFLGAHLIGAEVTEMIQSFTLAKEMEATEIEFIHTVFPHPTLSEMIHESVLDAFDRVIHL